MGDDKHPRLSNALLWLWLLGGVVGLVLLERYAGRHWFSREWRPLGVGAIGIGGMAVVFAVVVFVAGAGERIGARLRFSGIVLALVAGGGALVAGAMVGEGWLVKHLVPRAARAPVFVALAVLTVAGPFLASLALSRLRERRRGQDAGDAPPPPPFWSRRAAPPRPSGDALLGGALAQHLARAFTRWWRGLGDACPGCGASGLAVRLANERRVYGPPPDLYHFTSYDASLACAGCGWTLAFPHTDDPPQVAMTAPSLPPEKRPVRDWTIADGTGVAGTVRSGATPATVETPTCTPAGRAALKLAAALIEAAGELDLTGTESDPESIRAARLRGHLGLHGVRVVGEPTSPATELG